MHVVQPGMRRTGSTPWLLLAVVGIACVTQPATADTDAPEVYYYSFYNGMGPDPYPLDSLPRFAEERGRIQCNQDALVRYRSRGLRYAVRVHPAFAERLVRFETWVNALAMEHYGRAPRRLVHHGAFSCRRARGRRGRISEHAFGNALDLEGFDFGRLPRRTEAPAGMPRRMRRGFQVRVSRHWSPRRKRDDYHAAFLHKLAEGVRREPTLFRGIVGPPRPRHRNHLHLDAAPWTYAMFGYDRAQVTE